MTTAYPAHSDIDKLIKMDAKELLTDAKGSTVTIRATNSADITRIHEIENASFSVPWSKKSFVSILSLENFYSLTALCDSVFETKANSDEAPAICGFVIFTVAADEGEILDIATDKAFRRQGIAEKMMLESEKFMRSRFVNTVYLEVRRANTPAKKLYEKLGFSAIGIRRNYYKDPVEDAILMKKVL